MNFKTTDRPRVVAVFGPELMHAHLKDDVIAFLVHKRWPAEQRETWYRRWCSATQVFCSSVDLGRLKRARRRELQRPLPWATEP